MCRTFDFGGNDMEVVNMEIRHDMYVNYSSDVATT